MKQLSKLESAIFLLGGVLMVVGAHHTVQCNAGDAVL